jgi:hypothetical protein
LEKEIPFDALYGFPGGIHLHAAFRDARRRGSNPSFQNDGVSRGQFGSRVDKPVFPLRPQRLTGGRVQQLMTAEWKQMRGMCRD